MRSVYCAQQKAMNADTKKNTEDIIMENNNEKKMYLVTGGAGFLGGTICRKLLERGERVRTLLLEGDPAIKLIPEGIEVVTGNLCAKDSLTPFFDTPDGIAVTVIHVAGVVSMKEGYQQSVMDVNVGGTKNILDQFVHHSACKKLVYISSTGAIPELPKGQKICEVTHFDPDKVRGCYSQSKAIATQAVLDAVREEGIDASVVIPSGILGPGDTAMSNETTNTIVRIINGEMPVGIQGSFNLADVRDLADGCIAAADKGGRGECYILGNEEVTLRELSGMLDRELHCGKCKAYLPLGIAKKIEVQERKAAHGGRQPMMTSFAVYNLERNNTFDYSKAQRELGYNPRPYSETLRDEALWLKAAGKI